MYGRQAPAPLLLAAMGQQPYRFKSNRGAAFLCRLGGWRSRRAGFKPDPICAAASWNPDRLPQKCRINEAGIVISVKLVYDMGNAGNLMRGRAGLCRIIQHRARQLSP